MRKNTLYKSGFLLLVILFFCTDTNAQKKKKNKNQVATNQYEETLYEGLEYRLIGPFRGGRSAAVTGVPGEPNLFYFGSTGGGIWNTKDGGRTWNNISDDFFGGSIGSIAVAETDKNVIYVGVTNNLRRRVIEHESGFDNGFTKKYRCSASARL